MLDPDGKRLKVTDAGHGAAGSDTARVSLPAKLAQGTYTVAWRVVSADSHPVSGAFTFSVGKPSPATVIMDTGPTEDPATESLFNMGRYLAYLAVALLIGTAVFLLACRPPEPSRLRRLLWAGWGTLLGSTVFLLVLRAPYESGAGPASAFSLKAFERTLTTRPGEALLVRLALLLVGYFFVVRLLRLGESRLPRAWQAAGGALAVGLALTWASAEHASAGIQVPVAMTSAVLHVLAMAVWLGGLAALLTTLYRASSQIPAAVVARFSRLAFASVTVLVATGVYQSWRGLGSWDAVTGTTYGHLLVFKLLAVTGLLGAARLSRQWTGRLVTAGAQVESESVVRERVPEPVGGPPTASDAEREPAAPGGDSPAYRRGLRRSVLAEVAVGVVVLVLSTVLSGTLPGRAQAEAAEAGPATGGLPAASLTDVPFAVGGATRPGADHPRPGPHRRQLGPGHRLRGRRRPRHGPRTPAVLHPPGPADRPDRRRTEGQGRLLGHERPHPAPRGRMADEDDDQGLRRRPGQRDEDGADRGLSRPAMVSAACTAAAPQQLLNRTWSSSTCSARACNRGNHSASSARP